LAAPTFVTVPRNDILPFAIRHSSRECLFNRGSARLNSTEEW
jgi:hypothetical protein